MARSINTPAKDDGAAPVAPPSSALSEDAERLRVLDERRASLLLQREATRQGFKLARERGKATPEERRKAWQEIIAAKAAEFAARPGQG